MYLVAFVAVSRHQTSSATNSRNHHHQHHHLNHNSVWLLPLPLPPSLLFLVVVALVVAVAAVVVHDRSRLYTSVERFQPGKNHHLPPHPPTPLQTQNNRNARSEGNHKSLQES